MTEEMGDRLADAVEEIMDLLREDRHLAAALRLRGLLGIVNSPRTYRLDPETE